MPSRVETARQRVGPDQPASTAQALGTTLGTPVTSGGDDHVVVRPHHP